MHAANLIAAALRRRENPLVDVKEYPKVEFVDEICAVTGSRAACRPRAHLIGKSFTNLDLLAAPESSFVSEDVAVALGYKWERMSSWFCDGETFARLDRQGVRDMVIRGAYPPVWCAYATTSYKKHGALWTPVNSGGKAAWRFEGLTVDCSNHDMLLSMWDRLNKALRDGISRPSMETLVPGGNIIVKIGPAAWQSFEKWARPIFQGGLYQFLCYLLPSQEELKQEGE